MIIIAKRFVKRKNDFHYCYYALTEAFSIISLWEIRSRECKISALNI